MIRRWRRLHVKGFLWYQGESNCYLGETISYTYKMEALINNWRKTLEQQKHAILLCADSAFLLFAK
jgi:hypothetical protein